MPINIDIKLMGGYYSDNSISLISCAKICSFYQHSSTKSKFYRLTIVSKVEILKSLSSTPGRSLDVANVLETEGKNFHKHKLSWISLLQLAKWVPVEAVEYLAHIA